MKFFMFFYNLFLPIGFLFFLPGLLWKLYYRPGWKKTFGERFGVFSRERKQELSAFQGGIWVHAVSVGESVIALALVKKLRERHPDVPIVISTGTTTGQELVRKQKPDDVAAIFCPMDFYWMVRRTLKLLQPAKLVIFETEVWPNLICQARKAGAKVALVNARLSDHSAKSYRRFKVFFGPLFRQFDAIAAQSAGDMERILTVSPQAKVQNCGNLKFDQSVPADLQAAALDEYFKMESPLVLLAASTHPGEEKLIAETYRKLREKFADLRLVIVPRHAERGGEVLEELEKQSITAVRRSTGVVPETAVECLLADTTGEMLKLMKCADVVIMGKSLAGQDEGHNLIEPALLKKAIVTGSVLRNFRFLLKILTEANAIKTVANDGELEEVLSGLLGDEAVRRELGELAYNTIAQHAGATAKTLDALDAM